MATNKKRRGGYTILLIVYLCVLFYFLFFSEKMGRTHSTYGYQYNLTPFHEMKRFFNLLTMQHSWKPFLLNVVGNIIAFMPFGFLLPKVFEKTRTLFLIILFSFEMSLFAELIQLIFQLGCFDVDDLLLNTFGGFLGFLVLLMVDTKKRA